jgi:hypothetical protein
MQMQIEFKILTQLVSEQRCKCSSVFSISSDVVHDEDILQNMAYEHKVESCIYVACKENSELLTQESIMVLKKHVAIALLKRTIMQQQLSLIEDAFLNEGIKPLIIKGPASSLQLYGNPVTREYTDIDLVIAPEHFSQVLSIMENIGYLEKSGSSSLTDSNYLKNENVLMQKMHHLIFTSLKSPFRIEIHNAFFSGLTYNESYTTESVLARSVALIYQGITYHVPSIKDHVLLLIMHGTKHAWQSLHWLIDMVAVFSIEDKELHCDICRGIEDLHLQKHTALLIALIKELFSIEIPMPYMKYYTRYQKNVKRQLAIARHKLTSMNILTPSIWDTISFSWNYLVPLAETSKEKFKVGLNPFLISPQDFKTLRLPKYLMWLHILLRPLFVIERRLKSRWERGR